MGVSFSNGELERGEGGDGSPALKKSRGGCSAGVVSSEKKCFRISKKDGKMKAWKRNSFKKKPKEGSKEKI